MAIIGCSYLKGAIYNNNQGTVTYSNAAVLAKLVKMAINLDDPNDNDFYADNGIDESDSAFAGGNVEFDTNDLTDEISALILGLQTVILSDANAITGITDSDVKEILYDDRQVTPYMGIGVTVKHKRAGVDCYTAIVLPKIMFQVPSDAAETQGKQISWQTPTVKGKIFKDDTTYHRWKSIATFTTEAQAITYINARLPAAA